MMSDPENQASRFARDMAANAEKMFKATQLIANTRDEDVNIGTTPKHLVMRRDKVKLFHYEPMAAATAAVGGRAWYAMAGCAAARGAAAAAATASTRARARAAKGRPAYDVLIVCEAKLKGPWFSFVQSVFAF